MHIRVWFIIFLLLLSTATFAADKALLLNITGPIGPAAQDYIIRSIAYAEKQHDQVIILKLDTPGGLETSMRGINEAIITSPIPIITYVAPAGARAASAGTFIMYASHVSAMAPGTNIGAASPVNMFASGTPGNEKNEPQSTEEKKAINDAAAYIRSLAQLRDRNAEWGELAVRHAASLSAEEAKKMKVIDEIAENDQQLLEKADGHNTVVAGKAVKIHTKNLQIEEMPHDWRYDFLSFLTNPNVAYILMLIAVYGLFFELANPGAILPGVAGVIALLLVLYAFQLMPINYAGLALLLLGIVFMLFEVYVASFGVIGIAGIIAFILGSILLFDVHNANYQLDWMPILIMSTLTIIFFLIVLSLAIRSHKKAVVTGREGLIGSEGIVLNATHPQYVVRILGEIWDAECKVQLKQNDRVKVIGVKGLTLTIEPIKNNKE